LLTLSACSTAKDYRTRNGVEMDSLGMVAQQKEAAAVLATLWSVNDASTSLLMSDFYRRWATIPNIEKIEALRQAQIAMLHGKLQPAGETYDLSHPYYWAPFVLIGNFR
jgi:CHAT domain-containing protein